MKYSLWLSLALISAVAGYYSGNILPSDPVDNTVRISQSALSINSADGRYHHLSTDKAFYVAYFGFTRCPDVCPTSLAILSAALEQLSPAQRQQIQSLFISLDPDNDDAIKANQYAQFFHPEIVGLSPQQVQLSELSEQLGVYYKYVDTPESRMKYTVDHSSFFYFINPQGELLARVPHSLDPQNLLDTFHLLLKE